MPDCSVNRITASFNFKKKTEGGTLALVLHFQGIGPAKFALLFGF
jgi:hypothetical protein